MEMHSINLNGSNLLLEGPVSKWAVKLAAKFAALCKVSKIILRDKVIRENIFLEGVEQIISDSQVVLILEKSY